MTFIWPTALWLLLLLPLLTAAYVLLLRRKRKALLGYASPAMQSEIISSGPKHRRHITPMLLLISITILIAAVSRPAVILTLPSQRGTVILAMDISGSMRADDVEPNRMAAAERAARAFIKNQPKTVKIGIVAFASSSFVVQAPTLDRESLNSAINRFRTQIGTAVGSGIISSLGAIFEETPIPIELTPSGRYSFLGEIENAKAPTLRPVPPGTFSPAVVVLLTDGQTTHGPDPVQVAQIAADLGVRIYTVGLGTPEGVLLNFGNFSFHAILDEASLITIAELTEAVYYQAEDEIELLHIYETLSTELVFETEKMELTVILTALAAVLAMVAAGLALAWFGRMV